MRTLILATVLVASACAVPPATSQPTAAREVVSGSGRLRGNGVRMDVSIGGPIPGRKAQTSSVVLQPNSVVTP